MRFVVQHSLGDVEWRRVSLPQFCCHAEFCKLPFCVSEKQGLRNPVAGLKRRKAAACFFGKNKPGPPLAGLEKEGAKSIIKWISLGP